MRASSVRNFARGVGFGIIGSVLNKLFRYLFLLVATRVLSVSTFGLVVFLVGLYNLSQRFLMLGINKSIDYYVPKYLRDGKEDAARSVLFTAVGIVLIIGFFIGFIVVISAEQVARLVERPDAEQYVLLLAIALPIHMYKATLRNSFLAVKQVRYQVAMENIGYHGGKVLLLAFLVGALGYGPYGAFGAYVLATLAAAVGGTVLFVVKNRWVLSRSFSGGHLRDIVQYSLPLSAAIATAAVIGQIDVILLGKLATDRDVATYKIAYSVVMLLGFLPPAFNAIFKPIVAENEDDLDVVSRIHHNTTRWIVILTAPLVATIVAHPATTVAVLFGESYVGSPFVVWTLVVGQVATLSFGLQQSLLQGLNATRPVFSGKVAVLVTNVVVGLALIPRFGPLGAAVGTTTGLVLGAVYFAFVLHRTKSIRPLSLLQTKVILLLVPVTAVGFAIQSPNRVLELAITFVATGALYVVLLLGVGGLDDADIVVVNSIEERFDIDAGPVKRVMRLGISG